MTRLFSYLILLSVGVLSSAAGAVEQNDSDATILELRSAPPIQRLHPATGLPVISLAAFEPTKWTAAFDWKSSVEPSYLSMADDSLTSLPSSLTAAPRSHVLKAISLQVSAITEVDSPVRPLPTASSVTLASPADKSLLSLGGNSFNAQRLDISGGLLNK